MKRRTFLHRGAVAVATGACPTLVGCLSVNTNAKPVSASAPQGGRVSLGSALDLAAGGQLKVTVPGRDGAVLVARVKDGSVKAIELNCSHFGGEIGPFEGGYRCPSHGSRFAYDGSVVEGPADEPLSAYAVVEEQGQLFLVLDAK